MNTTWETILEQQFGAALDMLERAVSACPETLWADQTQDPEYWYLVYHMLAYLDSYLERAVTAFPTPAPVAPTDEQTLPETPFSKLDLQRYLAHGRMKAARAFEQLHAEHIQDRTTFAPGDLSIFELLLYNTRHIQHHTAQLYLILRQQTGSTPGWVGK